GNLLAHVAVVESELVAAVVTNRHGRGAESDDLNVVGMATFAATVRHGVVAMAMVAAVHGNQSCSDDGVWTVRAHKASSAIPRRLLALHLDRAKNRHF
ncbi:MAG: hypothetical protein ABI586_08855, partial [Candidatus Nanopelagicales bacterium]